MPTLERMKQEFAKACADNLVDLSEAQAIVKSAGSRIDAEERAYLKSLAEDHSSQFNFEALNFIRKKAKLPELPKPEEPESFRKVLHLKSDMPIWKKSPGYFPM